jgi:hypothetical protein
MDLLFIFMIQMNTDSFKDWFVNEFLECIQERFVTNMDGDCQHSVVTDTVARIK